MADRQSDIATIVLTRDEMERIHGEMVYVDGSEDQTEELPAPAIAPADSTGSDTPGTWLS